MVREPECGSPVMRRMSPSPSVDDIVAGGHLLERLRRRKVAGMIPDRPQRRILLAQTHRAKVCSPICRAARNSFRAVTASSIHTWWRTWASSSS